MKQFFYNTFVRPTARRHLATVLIQFGWLMYGLCLLELIRSGNKWYLLGMATLPIALVIASALRRSIKDDDLPP